MTDIRKRLVSRTKKLKDRLESESLVLSDLEEEFVDTLLWSVQEFLGKVLSEKRR